MYVSAIVLSLSAAFIQGKAKCLTLETFINYVQFSLSKLQSTLIYLNSFRDILNLVRIDLVQRDCCIGVGVPQSLGSNGSCHKWNLALNTPTFTTTCLISVTLCSQRPTCITDCEGLPDGDYQSCRGCHIYASCVSGILYDYRPCNPLGLQWDDNTKRCEVESTTCGTEWSLNYFSSSNTIF